MIALPRHSLASMGPIGVRMIGVASRLALHVLVARIYGPSVLGAFAAAQAAAQLLGTGVAGGLGQSILRLVAAAGGDSAGLHLALANVMRSWQRRLLVCGGLLILPVLLIGGVQVLAYLMLVLVCSASFMLTRVGVDALRGLGHGNLSLACEFALPGIAGLAAVTFVPRPADANLLLATAIVALAYFLPTGVTSWFVMAHKWPGLKPARHESVATMTTRLMNGVRIMSAGKVLIVAGVSTVTMALPLVGGPLAAAAPIAAMRILALPTFIMQGLASTYSRDFSIFASRGEISKSRQLLFRSQFISVLCTVPLITALLVSPEILGLIFGPGITVSRSLLSALCVAQLANAGAGLASLRNNMWHQEKLEMQITVLSTGLTIAGCIFAYLSRSVMMLIWAFAMSQVLRNMASLCLAYSFKQSTIGERE